MQGRQQERQMPELRQKQLEVGVCVAKSTGDENGKEVVAVVEAMT
jgi:hypothetical protein